MFHNQLRKARENKGWSQKQVAEKLNISEARYNNYETGKRKPDPEMSRDISNVLEVSADYLLQTNISKADKLQNVATIEHLLKGKGLENKEIHLVQNIIENLLEED